MGSPVAFPLGEVMLAKRNIWGALWRSSSMKSFLQRTYGEPCGVPHMGSPVAFPLGEVMFAKRNIWGALWRSPWVGSCLQRETYGEPCGVPLGWGHVCKEKHMGSPVAFRLDGVIFAKRNIWRALWRSPLGGVVFAKRNIWGALWRSPWVGSCLQRTCGEPCGVSLGWGRVCKEKHKGSPVLLCG